MGTPCAFSSPENSIVKTRLSLLAILLAFSACGKDGDEPRKQGEPDTAP